jgi:hypothetical protein
MRSHFLVATVSSAAPVASGCGAQRMVQLAGDSEEEYERLTAEGVTFLHSPHSVLGPDGRTQPRTRRGHLARRQPLSGLGPLAPVRCRRVRLHGIAEAACRRPFQQPFRCTEMTWSN